MTERIQKIISASGLMSRRAAEELIAAGKVTVNGVRAELGMKADGERDIIVVNGKALPSPDDKTYIMLNKPRGYVTTLSDEKNRPCVTELVKDAGVRLYPVGRLDMYSEGLLILTNDGDFANRLMHPSHEITKTYLTWVKGENIKAATSKLHKPIELDGCTVQAKSIEIRESFEDRAVLLITIGEGRNRQIRRMCESCGLRVTRLRRVSEGPLSLGELKSGSWRRLTNSEIRQVMR